MIWNNNNSNNKCRCKCKCKINIISILLIHNNNKDLFYNIRIHYLHILYLRMLDITPHKRLSMNFGHRKDRIGKSSRSRKSIWGLLFIRIRLFLIILMWGSGWV